MTSKKRWGTDISVEDRLLPRDIPIFFPAKQYVYFSYELIGMLMNYQGVSPRTFSCQMVDSTKNLNSTTLIFTVYSPL